MPEKLPEKPDALAEAAVTGTPTVLATASSAESAPAPDPLLGLNRKPANHVEAVAVFEKLFALLEAGQITPAQFEEFDVGKSITPSMALTMVVIGGLDNNSLGTKILNYLLLKSGYKLDPEVQPALADRSQPLEHFQFDLEKVLVKENRDGQFGINLSYICLALARHMSLEDFIDYLIETIIVAYEYKNLPFTSTRKGQMDDLVAIVESKLPSIKYGNLAQYEANSFTRRYKTKYRNEKVKDVVGASKFQIVKSFDSACQLAKSPRINLSRFRQVAVAERRPVIIAACVKQLEQLAEATEKEGMIEQSKENIEAIKSVIGEISSLEQLLPVFKAYTKFFEDSKLAPLHSPANRQLIWKLLTDKFQALIKDPNALLVAYMMELRDIDNFPKHALGLLRDEAVSQRFSFAQKLINLNPPASFGLALTHILRPSILETVEEMLFSSKLSIEGRQRHLIQAGIFINVDHAKTAINIKNFRKAILKAPDLEANTEKYYAYITQVLVFAGQPASVIKGFLSEVKSIIGKAQNRAAKQLTRETKGATHSAMSSTDPADVSDEDSDDSRQRPSGSGETASVSSEKLSFDDPAPPSPEDLDPPNTVKLSAKELNRIVRARIDATPTLEDLGRRSSSLSSCINDLEAALTELLLDDDKLATLSLTEPTALAIDGGSPLAMLGITTINIIRTEDHFDFQCVFGAEAQVDGQNRYLNGFRLENDTGSLSAPTEIFAAYPWLEPIFSTEVLRHLAEHTGLGTNELSLNHIRILLGLEAYIPPALAPRAALLEELQGSGESGSAAESNDVKSATESPETLNTREFTDENYDSFLELYLALTEDGLADAIPGSFSELRSAFEALRYDTNVSTPISPLGLEYEVPKAHPFKAYVDSIYLSNVPQSAEVIRGLSIRPELLHENIEDSNLIYVHITLPSGKEVTVHACVIPPVPPEPYKVYILGVNEETYLNEDTKDKIFIMFQTLILEAYHSAVACDYDSSRRSTSARKHGTGGGSWERKIRTLVDEMTKRELPVLIVLNPRKPSEQSGESGETHEPGPRLRPKSRQEKINEIFDRLAASSHPSATLAAHGLLAKGSDYLGAHCVNDVRDAFPPEAWDATGHNLSGEYERIYLPIASQERVAEVLYGLAQDRLYTPEEDIEEFVEFLHSDIAAGSSPAEAFNGLFAIGHLSSENPNFAFHMKARALFHAHKEIGIINFQQLYEYIAEQSEAMKIVVTPEKIVRALFTMSTFNPSKLNIATSGATEIRFPYLRSETDLPNDFIFTKEGSETDPDVDIDIIKVIPGNCARIVENGLVGLRGKNRSSEMNFAAKIQSRFHNPALGSEVNLAPRARALLVWEFADGGHPAYTLLDTARSKTKPKPISGAETLRSAPAVTRAAKKAKAENHSGLHTDFTNVQDWSPQELRRLAQLGVITLSTDKDGKPTITSSRPIARKKIVIFEGEQVGYKQQASDPVSFEEYLAYLHQHGEPIPAGIPFDPELAKIQLLFREILAA